MVERHPWRWLVYALFIAVSLFCVAPFFIIISASFSDEMMLKTNGYSFLPQGLTLDAYAYIFKTPKAILMPYAVTIFCTVIGTVASLVITAMMGYVCSRRDFKAHKALSFLVFFAMLFNVGLVATYFTMVSIYGLKDSVWAMIVPMLMSPWNVFLMKSFMNDVPFELIEAAKIDGSGEFRLFFQIIVPIAKPALATIGLFIAFAYWNDWYNCFLYINNNDLTSLQYYLYRVMSEAAFLSTNTMASTMLAARQIPTTTVRMAMCVLAAGPMLVVFPFFQKYFVRGLTVGSVKG
ncbi:MAG: carbohydrate ABC transporter permease [Oscillospiraceae bacterium]|nr:carbohydrate ABC transporter permease [Oscillospiraceae bacterium]